MKLTDIPVRKVDYQLILTEDELMELQRVISHAADFVDFEFDSTEDFVQTLHGLIDGKLPF